MKNPLFSMRHEELSHHFTMYKPYQTQRTGRILNKFNFQDLKGNESVNTVLSWYIYTNGFPFLYDTDGTMWFSDDGNTWKKCEVKNQDGDITVWECA